MAIVVDNITIDGTEIDLSSGSLTLDVAGDIILDAAGDQIYFKDAGSTRFTFNLDSTPELDVTGDFTIDCSGDIVLDAAGDQITFKDAGSTRYVFNLDSTPELDITGDFTIDCSGDIVLDADGGQITFKDGTASHFLFDCDNTALTIYDDFNSSDYLKIAVGTNGGSTISTYDNDGELGTLTLDVDGDITLDADGGQIYFKDAGVASFTFNLDSTPELDVTGDFTIDCSGDIVLDAAGSNITFKETGTTRFDFTLDATPEIAITGSTFTLDCSGDIVLDADGGQIHMKDGGASQFLFDMDNTSFVIYDDVTSSDYLKFLVTANAATTISTVDNDGELGHLTLDIDGDIVLDADGGQITFKDGGTSRFVFNLDSTPEVDITGDFTLDCSADVYIDAGGSQIYFQTGANYPLKFSNSAGEWTIENETSNKDIIFKVNDGGVSTEVMRLDGTTGWVGIGDTTPSAKIELYQDTNSIAFRATSDSTSQNVVSIVGDSLTSGNALYVKSNSSSTSTRSIAKIHQDHGSATGTTTLELVNDSSTADLLNCKYASTSRFRIQTDGKVGIGSTAPTSLFHVFGSTSHTSPMIKFESGDTSLSADQAILEIDSGDSSFLSNNYFIEFTCNGTILGSINSEVAYSTFTGQHPTQLLNNNVPVSGSILKSTGNVIYRSGLSNAWVETTETTSEKDKSVVGVYRGEWSTKTEISGMTHIYNALGEGQILVTDSGGNIEAGDYICSSARPGHGMLQDDDILHNYTVAKSTETIDFLDVSIDPVLGYKSYLLACTYHAG